ncbi:MAG: sterol desaturase family protein [Pseudomonadota bacterium]
MSSWFVMQEGVVRLAVFTAVILAMLAWQLLAPLRGGQTAPWRRWVNHVGLLAVGNLLIRALAPMVPVSAALLAARYEWGLLHWAEVPLLVGVGATVILLDALIYWQHRVFHQVPLLWRLHRVHHADTEFDVTTALRFHPVEIILSLAIKVVAVLALGAPAVGVLVFEILLNATAVFNHGNVSLPAHVDRTLRYFLVTPDMHRIHHSWHRDETDSNFGFCLPWWDRLFGSYKAAPRDGQTGMTIGLSELRAPQEQSLWALLLQPFRR